jgi:acetolactate synthase-1/2/3 large subunit
MIKVSDFIWKYLADYGIKHAFIVTGGASMHLNNSLKKEKRIKYICNHHEQACAIAAEGYFRASGKMAVVNVTSGPGGLNTLTGVMGQWTDSVPVLYISGQVKQETMMNSKKNSPKIRQLGDQEINIVDIVRPITKYVTTIRNANEIQFELTKALDIATSGRPGPVWLDIPLNIQGALINEKNLKEYKNKKIPLKLNFSQMKKVIKEIKNAKRPLFIAGNGIRISDSKNLFLQLIENLNIPVVTTFNGFDLLSLNNRNYIGRIGTVGDRAGNFALQNADLIVCFGTRNNIRQISYNWENFAKNAIKIIVDIDKKELNKQTIKGDILINANVKDFIIELQEKLFDFNIDNSWLNWCVERKNKYSIIKEDHKLISNTINPYYFINSLTKNLKSNDTVIAGNGTACVTLFQAGIVKKDQHMFWNSGCASMGYDLPAAIGACIATNKPIICIAGDGSLQMNLQELQTIKHYKLPIKLFVLNNQGYHSIVQTQTGFFNKNFIGCNQDSGVSFPNNKKLANLYNMKYFKIDSFKKMEKQIKKILNYNGTLLCEIILSNEYTFIPKLSSERKKDGSMLSKSLEDMHPFLDRKEFNLNMINNYE